MAGLLEGCERLIVTFLISMAYLNLVHIRGTFLVHSISMSILCTHVVWGTCLSSFELIFSIKAHFEIRLSVHFNLRFSDTWIVLVRSRRDHTALVLR